MTLVPFEYVGVTGLMSRYQDSPVGVYFMIDDNTFFAASIDAYIKHGGSLTFDQRLEFAQAQELTEKVHKALDEECESAAWHTGHSKFGCNLITACVRPYDDQPNAVHRMRDDPANPPDHKRPGATVAASVRVWMVNKLKAQLGREPSPQEDHAILMRATGTKVQEEGFVVTHDGDGENLYQPFSLVQERVPEPGVKEWQWVWNNEDSSRGWQAVLTLVSRRGVHSAGAFRRRKPPLALWEWTLTIHLGLRWYTRILAAAVNSHHYLGSP
ncbi:hypothetical protein LTR36_003558 [Oleoguttula mirabilis]|uniref:Uncharacterized protein n=1 Tax=Oleoguttula mirabilis TaxID=1507867 RepID=A0AAV9JJC3_9PEZI|nr:hypothetical protein LTR36_003558 [Oleoguttula mirabilis]